MNLNEILVFGAAFVRKHRKKAASLTNKQAIVVVIALALSLIANKIAKKFLSDEQAHKLSVGIVVAAVVIVVLMTLTGTA